MLTSSPVRPVVIGLDDSCRRALTCAPGHPSVKHLANRNFGRADQIIPGAAFRHLNNNKWARTQSARYTLARRTFVRARTPKLRARCGTRPRDNRKRGIRERVCIDAARGDAPAGRKQDALIESFCVSFIPDTGPNLTADYALRH